MNSLHKFTAAQPTSSWQPVDRPDDFYPMRLVLLPTELSYNLDEPDMVAGRHSTADLRLPMPDISRRHCRFVFCDSAWHAIDLGSLNGVWINNRRLLRAILSEGDRIRIGSCTFEVQFSLPHRATATLYPAFHGTRTHVFRRAS